MHKLIPFLAFAWLVGGSAVYADKALLKKHCAECHNDEKDKGDFNLKYLGDGPTLENLDYWIDSLDFVTAEEMPPEDESHLTIEDREVMIAFLDAKVKSFDEASDLTEKTHPRRLNNREFEYSIADALLIEDVGTHQPTDNLIGDTLHHGFDTHGETLGFSRFHLEQYVEAARKIVDGVILSGPQPETEKWVITPDRIVQEARSQNSTRPLRYGKEQSYDFLDPKLHAFFADFQEVPESGRYRITIKATAKDRLNYSAEKTGQYEGDALQLSVHMGNRVRTFNLPDEEVLTISLDEWLAEGTRLRLKNPSDGLHQYGNGNFKFQYRMVAEEMKKNEPARYASIVESILADPKHNPKHKKNIDTWHNWVEYYEGPRPRIFQVEIEGPIYDSWPNQRQVALIGKKPKVANAEKILKPIAERAWRRPVRDGELDKIVALVEQQSESMNDIDAIKEGIVSLFVSPAFLILNSEDSSANERFASKLSYFLKSTAPDAVLRESVEAGELDSFDSVREKVQELFDERGAEEFLQQFPFAWLELNDINFMAPDPDQYRFYHRKRVSEDMVEEVRHFFDYMITNNLPVPELLSADYSFINQDLARIYGVENEVPRDSKLRKFTFEDGRRGGLLGMSAFLTSTADSLSTSPIHRAVYVMENFMGIHPTPPPPNVEITEPDVRQAKTIKEVLQAHVADENCASCHTSIDPWGYAFENFDPTGAWRDDYVTPVAVIPGDDDEGAQGEVVYRSTTIPVDASAKFRNGNKYRNIVEYRKQLLTEANTKRFIRCFISKLLTYANGVEPSDADFLQIEKILETSEDYDYQIVDTIAAVIDSPLFRER